MIWTQEQVIEYINKQKEDSIFECVKKQKKSIRSLKQLKYYWWCVVAIISDYHWLTPIETNESLKLLFKKETFTDLSTEEFSFAVNAIREMWETKYWVIIPSPEDKNLNEYIDNQ